MAGAADDLGQHPDIAAFGVRAREEWRADVDRATADADEAWSHGRTISDIVCASMFRGDIVRVAIAGGGAPDGFIAVGAIVALEVDLLVVDAHRGRVSVVIGPDRPITVEVVEARSSGGSRGVVNGGGLRGALLAAEMAAKELLVVLLGSETVRGVPAVGADHVALRRGQRTILVSFAAIAAFTEGDGYAR